MASSYYYAHPPPAYTPLPAFAQARDTSNESAIYTGNYSSGCDPFIYPRGPTSCSQHSDYCDSLENHDREYDQDMPPALLLVLRGGLPPYSPACAFPPKYTPQYGTDPWRQGSQGSAREAGRRWIRGGGQGNSDRARDMFDTSHSMPRRAHARDDSISSDGSSNRLSGGWLRWRPRRVDDDGGRTGRRARQDGHRRISRPDLGVMLNRIDTNVDAGVDRATDPLDPQWLDEVTTRVRMNLSLMG